MVKSEFGKIVFIAQKDVKEGYLLRETSAGVVLEYYIPGEERVDVVAFFEGAYINNDHNFRLCLTEARTYVEDLKETIQVDLNTIKN